MDPVLPSLGMGLLHKTCGSGCKYWWAYRSNIFFEGKCIVFVRGFEQDIVLLLWLNDICIMLDLYCRFKHNMLGDNIWLKPLCRCRGL